MTATTTPKDGGATNLLDEFRTSSSLSPSLLHSLVHRLLSHPNVFTGFNDVLVLPKVIDALNGMDANRRDSLIRTVRLFAFGTIGQYLDARRRANGDDSDGGVWKLNDAQFEKLRMLTVATVVRRHVEGSPPASSDDACGGNDGAVKGGGRGGDGGGGRSSSGVNNTDVEVRMAAFRMESTKIAKGDKTRKKMASNVLSIPYSLLATELHISHRHDDDIDVACPSYSSKSAYNDIDHMRQLEDVLIQCVYSNIIAARLDQSTRTMTIMPHVSLSNDPSSVVSAGGGDGGRSDRGAFSPSEKGGGGGSTSSGKAVLGSILTRDLDVSTPEGARAEARRMLSSLRIFLDRTSAAWHRLDRTSRVVICSDRVEDEMRWTNVYRTIDGAAGGPPSSYYRHHPREYASSFGGAGAGGTSLSGGSGRVVSGDISGLGGGGTRSGGMRMNAGVVGGGGGGGSMAAEGIGGYCDPMRLADGGGEGAGRRQVKRSKGGHSIMMGRG